MKYRIVQSVDGALIATEPLDLEAWCAVAGVEITGAKRQNPGRIPLRECLVGQPILAGFAGPMFDGTDAAGEPVIRYEDAEAYRSLSA